MLNTSDLNVCKPVSVWNRDLNIKSSDFFLNATKTVLNLVTLQFSRVPENILDIGRTIGLKITPGQLAWILIFKSLQASIYDLIKNHRDLFYIDSNQKIEDLQLQELAKEIEEKFSKLKVQINVDFFDNPSNLSLLNEITPILQDWLQKLGMKKHDAISLTLKLPETFTLAIHNTWQESPQIYRPIENALKSPFSEVNRINRQWMYYHSSLEKEANKRMFGESISLKQVFVSPRAFYIEKIENSSRKTVVDLHEEISQWLIEKNDEIGNIRIILGDIGVGKSSFAKMLASDLAIRKNIFKILYIPLYIFEFSSDLMTAINSFLASDRYLSEISLRPGKSPQNILFVFDGLDELATKGQISTEAISGFIEKVVHQFTYFANQNLNWKVLLTGRELAFQTKDILKNKQVLYIMHYFYTQYEWKEYNDINKLLEIDQRNIWWEKYGKAKGEKNFKIPAVLRDKKFVEITRQPLLNYLLAIGSTRNKLDFSNPTTINEIYNNAIISVYERKYEISEKHKSVAKLKLDDFNNILEEIALAIWHEGGRFATVTTIYQYCKRSNLQKKFDLFIDNNQEQFVEQLLIAFYFNRSEKEKSFEFSHKSFGEYLTGRRLILMLKHINEELENHLHSPKEGWNENQALVHLLKICGKGRIDVYLYDFIKNEIKLHEEETVIKWQKSLCRLLEFIVIHGMPIEELGKNNFQDMASIIKNAEEALLALHHACGLVTKKTIPIEWKNKHAFGKWLKSLHSQYINTFNNLSLTANIDNDSRQIFIPSLCCLGYLNLNEQSIMFQFLRSSIFTGSKFNKAPILKSFLSGTNLSSTCFTGTFLGSSDLNSARFWSAHLANVTFSHCDLNCVIFGGVNCENTKFERNTLSGTEFGSAKLTNVEFKCNQKAYIEFNRAILNNVKFIATDLIASQFENAKLSLVCFAMLNLCQACFKDSVIKNSDFRFVNLCGANFEGARIADSIFGGAFYTNIPDEERKNLKLEPSNAYYSLFIKDTIFPAGFNPNKYSMTNIWEYFKNNKNLPMKLLNMLTDS